VFAVILFVFINMFHLIIANKINFKNEKIHSVITN